MKMFSTQNAARSSFLGCGGGFRGGDLIVDTPQEALLQFVGETFERNSSRDTITVLRNRTISYPQKPPFEEIVKNNIIEATSSLSPDLTHKIKELFSLKEGWDGENAKPIKSHVFVKVIEVLCRLGRRADFEEPFLAPTFDGFVQMDWHNKTRSLEIEALSDGWSVVGVENITETFNVAKIGSGNIERLERCYEWYLGNELLWVLQ